MNRLRRSLLACSLLTVAALGGCDSLGRLFSNHEFLLPSTMPSDLLVAIQVKEAAQPPVDYMLQIDRSGKVEYEVVIRAPKRQEKTGQVELSESELVELFAAIQASGFDQLEDVYNSDNAASDPDRGTRAFYVYADANDKRIDVDHASVPPLDELQARIVSIVPDDLFRGGASSTVNRSNIDEFVADTSTELFHLPGCERVKTIQPGNRRAFPTPWQALDFKFDPCEVCNPMDTKSR